MNNGALVLKSKNQLNIDVFSMEYDAYKARVIANGGYIVDEQAAKNAINFATSAGITKEMDAGIASPAWGVKKTGAITYTLFSLFNPDSDIDAVVPSGSVGVVDGVNVVSLVSTLSNGVSSKGFTANTSLVAMNINKPPILADGATYGAAAKQFSQIKVFKENADKTQYDSLIEYYYDRADATKTPSQWYSKVGTNRIAPLSTSHTYTIPSVFATEYSSSAIYIDSSKLKVFNKGASIYDYALVPQAPFSGTYKAYFARRFSATNATTLISPTYTNIAELWLVSGGSELIAQKMSDRANKIYNA